MHFLFRRGFSLTDLMIRYGLDRQPPFPLLQILQATLGNPERRGDQACEGRKKVGSDVLDGDVDKISPFKNSDPDAYESQLAKYLFVRAHELWLGTAKALLYW